MSKGIRISEKHGVNPMIPKCFWCGESKNEIVLLGKLKDDAKAPHGVAVDMNPCGTCAEYMKKGIICISIDESKTPPNAKPQDYYRSGGWAVITEEAVRRLPADADYISQALNCRVLFFSDAVWDSWGFLSRDGRV